MVVKGPQTPQDYAAPLINFSQIANAPKTYFEGQQQARITKLQNAFPNGLEEFKDPKTGKYDVPAISNRLATIGGAEYAKETLPLLLQQQTSASIGEGLADIDRNLTGGAQTAPSTLRVQTSQTSPQPAAQQTPATARGSITGEFPQAQNRTAAAPVPVGSASGAPAQTGGTVPQQPTASQQPLPQQGGTSGMGAAGIPFSKYPETIQNYDGAIQHIHNLGVQAAAAKNPEMQKSLEAKAAGLQTIRDKLFDELSNRGKEVLASQLRTAEPSNESKLAHESGLSSPLEYEGAKKTQDAELKHFDNLNTGIQALGNTSAGMLQNVNLQNSLVNHPDFYSGTGESTVLFLKRAFPKWAGDAAPMELYKKVLSKNMLETVTAMKEEGKAAGLESTRLFAPMIKMVEDANGTLDNSPLGLRSLAILTKKATENNIQIANFATAYKTGHFNVLPDEFKKGGPSKRPGVLDDNFEKGLRDWISAHPILTQEEQDDPRVLGARTFNSPQEAHAGGVQSGEPIRRGDNGKILYLK